MENQPRRRNSTYLALACANAVSQGAMTRSLRQIFENAPVQQAAPPLLSREEIKQAIKQAKLRRNSIAVQPDSANDQPDPSMPFSSTVMAVPAIVVPSPPTPPPKPSSLLKQQQQQQCFRCDKCSSILPCPPQEIPAPPDVEKSANEPVKTEESPAKLTNVPTNREVNEEELPKPDTVKNARSLFESSAMSGDGFSGFSTLQHVKSNPASRIVRSESTMTLDRASTASRPASSRFRWPCRQDYRQQSSFVRSPSPSPAPSPLPTAPFGLKSKNQPSYYRSTPSLTQYGQKRYQDAESCISEAGSDCWSSDLDSESSCFSSSGRDSTDPLNSSMEGMRYISPEVMDKIRSYGMTLTFVNGKMVDEDELDEALAKQNERISSKPVATTIQQTPIHSAGQSRSSTGKAAVAKTVETKRQSPQPRIVACVPKPSESKVKKSIESYSSKVRHSSGESSASSGVSSASSEHNSPFATLKRTKSSEAEHVIERSPSPGPRRSGASKALGSSPFGCYSVVYSFDASIQRHSAQRPMFV